MINFVCLQTRQKDTIFNIMILASKHNVNYFKLFRMITGFTLVSVLQCDLASPHENRVKLLEVFRLK